MGQKKKKLDDFKIAHPRCCYCGGARPTETFDHMPQRAFFRSRQWPAGYEFPACSECNSSTRVAEQVIAAVARSAPAAPMTDKDQDEIADLYRGVIRSDRAAMEEFLGRERLTQLLLPQTVTSRLSSGSNAVVNIGPLIAAYLSQVLEKLGKALYYRHAERIAPSFAQIHHMTISNADGGSREAEFMANLTFLQAPLLFGNAGGMELIRVIRQQFEYNFKLEFAGQLAGFKVRLHGGLLSAIIVDARRVESPSDPVTSAADHV